MMMNKKLNVVNFETLLLLLITTATLHASFFASLVAKYYNFNKIKLSNIVTIPSFFLYICTIFQ